LLAIEIQKGDPMGSKIIKTIAPLLALCPIAHSQTKNKIKEKKQSLFEYYQRILEVADEQGIDFVGKIVTEEDLDIILAQLRSEGIEVKKIDIKESLLGTQGAVD
jgi:hypothetical protein